MCEIETTIDVHADLTVHTVTGGVKVQDILDELRRYFAGVPTRFILWDFTAAGLEELSTNDVRSIVLDARKYAPMRPAGRTAFVVASDVAFGLGRMLDQALGALESPTELMTFRDRAAALAWLEAGS